MSHRRPKRIALICEAGVRFKYPQVFDLGELVVARSDSPKPLVEVYGPNDPDVPHWNKGRGIVYRPIGGTKPPVKFAKLWFLCRCIPGLLRSDAVVVFSAPTLPLALLARALGKPAVYYALELEIPFRRGGGYFAPVQYLLRHVPSLRIFTTGRHRSRLLKKALRLPSLPGTVECAALKETNADVPMRSPLTTQVIARLGFKPNLVIVADGGLDEAYCFDLLLNSRFTLDQGVVFACFGPIQPEIERCITKQTRGLGSGCENIVYLGEIPGTRYDLIEFMRGADVGLAMRSSGHQQAIINLRYYTPNKVYDYLAAGLPVLVSSQLSLRWVESERIGLQLDAEAQDCFDAAIQRLLEDREALSELKCRVRDYFPTQGCFEQTAHEIVATILANHDTSTPARSTPAPHGDAP